MIDQLVHYAEVISLKGDSYQLRDRDRDRDLGRPPARPRARNRLTNQLRRSPAGPQTASRRLAPDSRPSESAWRPRAHPARPFANRSRAVRAALTTAPASGLRPLAVR